MWISFSVFFLNVRLYATYLKKFCDLHFCVHYPGTHILFIYIENRHKKKLFLFVYFLSIPICNYICLCVFAIAFWIMYITKNREFFYEILSAEYRILAFQPRIALTANKNDYERKRIHIKCKILVVIWDFFLKDYVV